MDVRVPQMNQMAAIKYCLLSFIFIYFEHNAEHQPRRRRLETENKKRLFGVGLDVIVMQVFFVNSLIIGG
jgi:hypothetical protein